MSDPTVSRLLGVGLDACTGCSGEAHEMHITGTKYTSKGMTAYRRWSPSHAIAIFWLANRNGYVVAYVNGAKYMRWWRPSQREAEECFYGRIGEVRADEETAKEGIASASGRRRKPAKTTSGGS